MSFKHHLLFLTLIGSLLNARIANACSCFGAPPRVLGAYERASVVVIAWTASFKGAAPGEGYEGISSIKMVVEKVFKGNLKAGDEMTFRASIKTSVGALRSGGNPGCFGLDLGVLLGALRQGHNVDCIWGFEESFLQRFLLYLGPVDEDSGMWYVTACGRSRNLQVADDQIDDLLYLNKLEEVRGKTRIAGTIQFLGGADVSVEGRTIRILGGDKSYEAKTNKNGVYEIYDLPAGKYAIEPEVPTGWKLAEPRLHYSPPQGEDQEGSPKKFPVALEDKGEVGLDFNYEIDPRIQHPTSTRIP
jgi:hypothetical protein